MKKYTYIIISVFVILQLIILFVFGYTPYPDSDSYIRIARHCVDMGQPYPVTSDFGSLSFIWNVGAINAVALSLYLFRSVVPLLILYTLMKGATAYLLYQIAHILFKEKVAFITLILYVIYPANYGEATSTLAEVPFAFFILLGIWTVLKYKENVPLLISSGMILAVANWFRPLAIVFLLSLCIYLVIIRQKDFIKSLCILSGFILMIGVIGSISAHRTGHFIYQAQSGWQNLMQYSWDHNHHIREDRLLYTKGNPMYIENDNHIDCFQRDSVWRRRCISWIVSHPGEYIRQMPYKILKTYVSDNVNLCAMMKDKNKSYMYGEISMLSLKKDFPNYSYIQTFTVINLLYYYILIILFIISSTYMIYNKNKHIYLSLLIIILGTASIALVAHGETRFHNPYMPFIIMTAACYICKRISEPRST